jgi:hypothetical protein
VIQYSFLLAIGGVIACGHQRRVFKVRNFRTRTSENSADSDSDVRKALLDTVPCIMTLTESLYISGISRRGSSLSRHLLNPPQTSEFYGPRSSPSRSTSEVYDMTGIPSLNKNVIPVVGRATMVEASKRAFLHVRPRDNKH